jgi:sulfhydrogenase subunit beta (sulfur reductase)
VVTTPATHSAFLRHEDLDALIQILQEADRTVIGPRLREEAIVYDEITSMADLPVGWTDEQAPGRYRLKASGGSRVFDYSVGPTSWKRFTFPPRVPLGSATRSPDGSASFTPAVPEAPRLAFLGVRACDIAALLTQDRVLEGGSVADEDYHERRAAALIIAVQCTRAGATCFCGSMGTGPEVRAGHDLVLTELDEGFLVRAGSEAGKQLMARLPLGEATPDQIATVATAVASTREATSGAVVEAGLRDRLMDQLDSPRWAEVADRCLACTNCTLVCPTCFCTSVSLASDLDGAETTMAREWDSCFSASFAKVAGGNFRPRRQDRYRQWLTHKFATWYDQFGSSGCVGCGRCITWCPVGIDVREELAAIAPPYKTQAPPPPVISPSPGSYAVATVRSVTPETLDTSTLCLEPAAAGLLATQPGQFVMVEQPGFPSLPISVSRVDPDALWLTIRAAGPATAAAIALQPGSQLGLRGPLGRGWPIERAVGRDVVVVTGGIGLAPLRPLIHELLRNRKDFGELLLAYGARTPADRLYVQELDEWHASGIEVAQIVDRAGPEWLGQVGVVTQLLDRRDWHDRRGVAFVCGPERMMQATVAALRTAGISRPHIFVSMERHMECGVGLCGHCQMGPFFICRDGPVFAVSDLGDLFGREGI